MNGIEVELDHLKCHIAAYFMKLYKEPGIRRSKLNGVRFKCISASMRVWLERPFEEMKRVVWSKDDDKALGLDGFTMAFFKSCWDIVKGDPMEIVINF